MRMNADLPVLPLLLAQVLARSIDDRVRILYMYYQYYQLGQIFIHCLRFFTAVIE